MSRISLIIFSLFLLNFVCSSQIDNNEKLKCFEKGNRQRKYTEWECGKTPGVVDCNEK